jgi:hypothetical protein
MRLHGTRLSRGLPLTRFERGLLAASLPRRFIPTGPAPLPALPYFLPGRSDQPFPYPIGKADPCQGRGLSDECVVLGSQTDADGR